MKKIFKRINIVLAVILTIVIVIKNISYIRADKEEFKGVWVSTVYNLDWSHKDSINIYKNDLDLIKSLGLNTVIFQVRPMGDAFYESKYTSWSKYIGESHDGDFDPLQFVIEEANLRGLDFQAWFNPFRISTSSSFDINEYLNNLPNESILKNNPEWIVRYEGDGKVYHWLNPGEPKAREYIIDLIIEVVKKYNIDGIHLDDYFYPYPLKGAEFNDEKEFEKYGSGYSSKDDWRRDNVNKFVESLSEAIKKEKDHVDFGISPFGIWKNDINEGGSGTRGLSSYYELYCDTVKFIDEGWIDYVLPQLYWEMGHDIADYKKLVDWWSEQTDKSKTKLYIGHAAYKEYLPNEIRNQINYNKDNKKVDGSCFFSLKDIKSNNGNIQEQIKGEFYKVDKTEITELKEPSNNQIIILALIVLLPGLIILLTVKSKKKGSRKRRGKF